MMKDNESINEVVGSAQEELRKALSRHIETITTLEKRAMEKAEGNEELILATAAMTFASGAITLEREIRSKNEKQLQDLGEAIDHALTARQKMHEKMLQLASQGVYTGLTSNLINILLVALPIMAGLYPSILSLVEWRNIFLILVIALGIFKFILEAVDIVRAKRLSSIIQSEEISKADKLIREKINRLRDFGPTL